MISALVLSSGGPAAPPLAIDLAAGGVDVAGETSCANLLQDVIRKAADILICFQDAPDAALFCRTRNRCRLSTMPGRAVHPRCRRRQDGHRNRQRVHAYVVAGYSRNRLRSVVQLAQARFRHEQILRQELADIRKRFDERKLVDRAKGILMGARQLREEEAFRALRNAAMASKQRIGQVSQVLIDTAHYAEAVNRAGQLRMLTQRIVKFYALACTGSQPRKPKAYSPIRSARSPATWRSSTAPCRRRRSGTWLPPCSAAGRNCRRC